MPACQPHHQTQLSNGATLSGWNARHGGCRVRCDHGDHTARAGTLPCRTQTHCAPVVRRTHTSFTAAPAAGTQQYERNHRRAVRPPLGGGGHLAEPAGGSAGGCITMIPSLWCTRNPHDVRKEWLCSCLVRKIDNRPMAVVDYAQEPMNVGS